eukprot:398023_1
MNTNSNNNNNNKQHHHINRPFTINDTSIDHLVDPICFEISKSHTSTHFNYNNYVKQCQLYPQQSLQSKVELLQNIQNNSNDKKRKREQEISQLNTPIPLNPTKKQKLIHNNTPIVAPPLPIPSLPMTTTHRSPFLPNPMNNTINNKLPQIPLLTPSPRIHSINTHTIPPIPPLTVSNISSNITTQSSSPISPLSLIHKTPQSSSHSITHSPLPIINNNIINNSSKKEKKKKSKKKHKHKSKKKKKGIASFR